MRKVSRGSGSQCFSQPQPRCALEKIWKKFDTIWTNPESQFTRILGISPTYCIMVQCKARSKKGVAILSNSITCNDSVMHTTGDLFGERGMHEKWVKNFVARLINPQGYRVLHLSRIRRTVVRIHLTWMRENPITMKARSVSTGGTCGGNIDF